jgi:hypothetical protein
MPTRDQKSPTPTREEPRAGAGRDRCARTPRGSQCRDDDDDDGAPRGSIGLTAR